jgi:Tfp pilus assembly protein PilF
MYTPIQFDQPSRFCALRAQNLMEDGLKAASQGLYERATIRFKDSLRLKRTAEAFTFWAWVESSRGNIHVAAHLCREALRIDGEFGNASNDLGSYLAALGDVESAIKCFEAAKKAKNYTSRHFPYMNLGRIYRDRNEYWKAFKEYKEASKLCPDLANIKTALAELEPFILRMC